VVRNAGQMDVDGLKVRLRLDGFPSEEYWVPPPPRVFAQSIGNIGDRSGPPGLGWGGVLPGLLVGWGVLGESLVKCEGMGWRLSSSGFLWRLCLG
jgi:hypothetical protein